VSSESHKSAIVPQGTQLYCFAEGTAVSGRWKSFAEGGLQFFGALLPILLAVLGACVTFWAPSTNTEKWVWFGVFILLGIAAFITVLRERQATRRNHSRVLETQNTHALTLEKIRENLADNARSAAAETNPYANIKHLSDQQLARLGRNIASEMRIFEVEHQNRDRSHLIRLHIESTSATSDETKRLLFNRNLSDMTEHREAMNREFKTKFLQNALLVRNELCTRLKLPLPQFGLSQNKPYGSIALDDQMLAGVNPIGEAASIIEDLARRLG